MMKAKASGVLHKLRWLVWGWLHSFDYALLLPLLGRLPLPLGYALAAVRGWINGGTGRDWRSMMLRNRHVLRQSAAGYQLLLPSASAQQIRSLVRERFATESREEFESRLIIAGRVPQLRCDIDPAQFLQRCLRRERGLVLLTPHFDSFTLGIVFLGRAGVKINAMSSLGDGGLNIDAAVYRHFIEKYQCMERYMNGGRVMPMEAGPRPFYQMLARGECLVILGDIPLADNNSTAATPLFLGARRVLSGGALRMAQKTSSDIGAFVCNFDAHGKGYRLTGSAIRNATDPDALDNAYAFLSEHIIAAPGRWWAADLLAAMPGVEPASAISERS